MKYSKVFFNTYTLFLYHSSIPPSLSSSSFPCHRLYNSTPWHSHLTSLKALYMCKIHKIYIYILEINAYSHSYPQETVKMCQMHKMYIIEINAYSHSHPTYFRYIQFEKTFESWVAVSLSPIIM